ncbi:glycosyl hydrolase family 61-domain-containing protein [Podospora fimiseda]|uniref:lytic cellulose monooxygenase (C4-dehydrogenating) n=1 Tax=Podospora fimiseda TaxID=252190 RepID=A0AAN7BKW3_9PEZI|nr:glycosyl hydrolase family 61-domain-containing protein [Podospora fimiseda]
MQSLFSLLLLLFSAGTALAHSHLAHIIINGNLYHGYDPRPNIINFPNTVGWASTATDDGFVPPSNYTTPDIICHRSGTSPKAHAPIKAGERIHVQWNGWPQNHVGPILSYLAPCTGTQDGCTSVDKLSLRWTKVDDSSPVIIDPAQGTWVTNLLIRQNNSWQVEIPQGLKPGPYVLRNEIIALHYANKPDGAQNYPLCMNLWVEPPVMRPTATFKLDSFDAMEFYKPEDQGISVDVFGSGGPNGRLKSYVVPGPTVAVGSRPVSHSEQRLQSIRREGTPVVVMRATETVKWTTTTGVARREEVEAEVTEAPEVGKGRYDRRG